MMRSANKLSFNKYDWYIILIIGSLAFGKVGGAFQAIRLISIFLLPFNIHAAILGRERFYFKNASLFAFCFFLYGLISLTWSVDYFNAKIELVYIFLSMNIIYSLTRFAKRANHTIESLIGGWSLFMLLTLPIAMWELTTSNHLYTLDHLSSRVESGRLLNGVIEKFAGATFGNPNEYNTVISFMLPYLFLNVLLCENNKQYLFSVGLLLLTIIVPVINSSRGSILAICIDAIIFLYFYYKRYGRRNKGLIYGTLCLVVSISILYGNILFDQLIKRSYVVNALEDDGRMSMVYRGLDLFIDSNFWGIGPMGYSSTFLTGPHNLFAEFLIEYGLYIFLFACFVLSSILYRLYKLTQGTFFVYVPICFACTFPFISVINSDYLEYPSFWVAIGSLYVMYIGLLMRINTKNIL